jgi:hypothetical protein
MSYIQPTEADREDVRRLLIAWGKPYGLIKEVARIRADATKAERERLAKVIKSDIEQRRIEYEEKHRGMWHSFEYSEGLLNASDIAAKAILSDDQEARNG